MPIYIYATGGKMLPAEKTVVHTFGGKKMPE